MTIVHVDHQIDSNEIARRVWEKDHAEVDLSTLTLEELADLVGIEHDLVTAGLNKALAHAIAAGMVLMEIRSRLSTSQWKQWREGGLGSLPLSPKTGEPITHVTICRYVRFAYYRGQLQEMGVTGTGEAQRVLEGLPHAFPGGPDGHPQEMKDRAQALHDSGESVRSIAADLGVNWDTVRGWIDPSYAMKLRRQQRDRAARRRAERKALAEQQEREERGRLARERGGNLGKAYDVVRKLHPIIDAAVAEGLSVEARALLVRVEDEIFKALKS